jgi:hypothetical protein
MFSPMPDILRHGGRGLIEGIVKVWESMNNILCLHEDYMKWIVNPSKEINIDGLVDPTDTEDMPGKEFLTRDTPQGQQVIRVNDRRDTTASVLSNLQYYDQIFQHGSIVTDAVQGLPGYRQDMTARESAQNLNQSLSIYSLMGENLEDGGINAAMAAYDVLKTFATAEDYQKIIDRATIEVPPAVMEFMIRGEVPELEGQLSISGLQSMLRDKEVLQAILQYIQPMLASPLLSSYVKPYKLAKAIERRADLKDEDILVDSETGNAMDQMMQQQQMAPGGAQGGVQGAPAGGGGNANPAGGVA